MDWTQAFAIIASLGAFMFWIFSKLDGDMKSLSAKLDADIKSQTARTDQLYQMFIDLLKERK